MIFIVVVKPQNFIHYKAFIELADLLKFSLIENGLDSEIVYNKIPRESKNIIIGAHLMSEEMIPIIPKDSIIFNTEQVVSGDTNCNEIVYKFAREFKMIDYSEENIQKFKELGFDNVEYLRIGFQKELRRVKKELHQDVDVLFYGTLNNRRRKILKDLIDQGICVKHLFGVYGEERDQWISRSKVVLNMHFYESKIFEIVRVFYLMTNSVAVVSEIDSGTKIDPIYVDGVHGAPYDKLVTECLGLIKDEKYRINLQNKAFETIFRYPQHEYTNRVICNLKLI